MAIRQNLKPILTLFILSCLLTELISGNTPAGIFFNPLMFLFLGTLGYGFLVLFIREIAVRRNYGVLAILALGVAYGLYNEGLVARTIFNPFHSPIIDFSVYGLVGNLRLPWALYITFWHAMHAVLYPIIFVYYIYPSKMAVEWVGKKTLWFLAVVCFAFGFVAFLSSSQKMPSGNLVSLIFILIAISALWIVAKKLPNSTVTLEKFYGLKPIGYGILMYLLFEFAPYFIVKIPNSATSMVIYFFILVAIIIKILSKKRTIPLAQLVLFALGNELALAFLNMIIFLVAHIYNIAITSLLFVIVFIVAIIKVINKEKLRI